MNNKQNGETKSTTNSNNNNLADIFKILMEKVEIKIVAPLEIEKIKPITEQQTLTIIQKVQVLRGFSSPQLTLAAIALLFAKGMTNVSTPLEIEVTVTNAKQEITKLTKGDFLDIYREGIGNTYIRRFAESNGEILGKWFEKNNKQGDAANRINWRLIAYKMLKLTSQEKSWCCTFAQNYHGLSSISERLP